MEQQTLEIIAADLGNGWLKMGKVIAGNRVETTTIPQVVGIGTTDIGMLGMGTKRVNKKDKPLTVQIAGEDTSWLVGPNVGRYTQTRERLDSLRLSGPELRALLYAGLWQMTGPGSHRVALMVGLPVETTKDPAAGSAKMRELRNWMVGEHAYSVNGEETVQDIVVVNGTSQPLGTYYAWGMNGHGNKKMKEAQVAVCDIGHGTLDLFVIQDGIIAKDHTEGANLGTHRVTDQIIKYIWETWRFTLSTSEADELLRTHGSGKAPILYHARGETDLSDLIEKALGKTFVDINNFIRKYWEQGTQFHYLLMTGGGAYIFRKQILAHYPFAIVMPNAVTANVEGIALLAKRKYESRALEPAA